MQKILIPDEPTTVLTPQETDELFEELKHLRDEGHTIIFISHKLYEVKKLCDRVSIMKNGRMVATRNISEVTEADISRLMVGRDVVEVIEKRKQIPKRQYWKQKGVTCRNNMGRTVLDHVSLRVRSGEILDWRVWKETDSMRFWKQLQEYAQWLGGLSVWKGKRFHIHP